MLVHNREEGAEGMYNGRLIVGSLDVSIICVILYRDLCRSTNVASDP